MGESFFDLFLAAPLGGHEGESRMTSENFDAWWRNAVVYQVYIRSFKDSDGDGVGDLEGLRSELSYIANLGCDAIWLNPCYQSPQHDHGYDIADYRSIDADYGTLEDFDALVCDAHRLGLRVVMDIVPNHCSSEHPWFQDALSTGNGSDARERFIFVDGYGENGDSAPNAWKSVFGGSAWTRVSDGQWYLHSFDSEQPDFNWRSWQVRDEFESVLRFWFERGVDGFRIDVAHGLVKAGKIPRSGSHTSLSSEGMWDQPEVHDIYRRWRRIADEYNPPKYLVGEVWVRDPKRFAHYSATDELHQAFSFDLLVQPWVAHRLRAAIEKGTSLSNGVDGPAWTLANHDVHRAVTRYGQEQYDQEPDAEDMLGAARRRDPVDIQLGIRRAKAAIGLVLALPGTVYLYQGEELGLPEVLELPDECRQDPIWFRSTGKEYGRDGCRIPMPWTDLGQTCGFSPADASKPWLPQPEEYRSYNRDSQFDDPDSFLRLEQKMLRIRREYRSDIDRIEWDESAPEGILLFGNGAFFCFVNANSQPYSLKSVDELGELMMTTSSSSDDPSILAGNSTNWFKRLK